MPTFKITLAYDGTEFVGWQRQANGVSIQGLIENALADLAGAPVAVAGAGRTDAGVHALGQVASFSLARAMDGASVVRALNATLPRSIRVLAATVVPSTFHARFAARSKTYRYRMFTGDVLDPFERSYVWHVPAALDVEAMRRAASQLEGTHDFAAFQAASADTRNTLKTVFASRVTGKLSTTEDTEDTERDEFPQFRREQTDLRVPRVLRGGDFITYEITGDGFLRHMVRTIVGSLVEIGRGRRDARWLGCVMESRDRRQAGPTAPAAGLFLVGVHYDRDALAAEP
ncbi:MAG TPA: tRNA pseudouridine synthase A [Vicinamibacterales bacterium]